MVVTTLFMVICWYYKDKNWLKAFLESNGSNNFFIFMFIASGLLILPQVVHRVKYVPTILLSINTLSIAYFVGK